MTLMFNSFGWQACMVYNMDGVDLVAKEQFKQELESVGLLLSDEPYVESNNHRFTTICRCGHG